jgi:hypothetical protein
MPIKRPGDRPALTMVLFETRAGTSASGAGALAAPRLLGRAAQDKNLRHIGINLNDRDKSAGIVGAPRSSAFTPHSRPLIAAMIRFE